MTSISAPPAGGGFAAQGPQGPAGAPELPGSVTPDGVQIGSDGAPMPQAPEGVPSTGGGEVPTTETFTRTSGSGGGGQAGPVTAFGPTTVVSGSGGKDINAGGDEIDTGKATMEMNADRRKQDTQNLVIANKQLQSAVALRGPLNEEIAKQRAEISRLSSIDPDDRTDSQNAALSKAEGKLNTLEGQLGSVEKLITKCEGDIGKLEQIQQAHEMDSRQDDAKIKMDSQRKSQKKEQASENGGKDSVIAAGNKNAANAAQVGAPGSPQTAKPAGSPTEQAVQEATENVIQGKARGGAA